MSKSVTYYSVLHADGSFKYRDDENNIKPAEEYEETKSQAKLFIR